jgi:hypothetical protein
MNIQTPKNTKTKNNTHIHKNSNPHMNSFANTTTMSLSRGTNTIPDISYHLIYCFLSLKELTLVGQCGKTWNRLVTEPSFLNLFRHQVSSIEINKLKVHFAM